MSKFIKIIGAASIAFAIAFLRNYCYTLQMPSLIYLAHGIIGIIIGVALNHENKVVKAFAYSLFVFSIILIIPNFSLSDLMSLIPLLIGIALTLLIKSTKGRLVSSIIFLAAVGYYSVNKIHSSSIYMFDSKVATRVYPFLDNGYKHFPEMDGRVKIIELWFVDCVPCRDQMVFINRFKKEYSENPNVSFITLNIANDKEERIRKLIEELNVSAVIGIDSAGYFQSMTKLNGFPQLLILDRNNNLKYVYHGFHKESKLNLDYWLHNSIEELENQPLSL